ncbi:hypothetical protein GpartN1_g7468.t1 [Galdieria partita]|uniref:Uncharacterized protein n=1 Tax=Galdieria partita TaxID=83374 RepID=A0A9C7Q5D7_9RHOD|nr:hypothetical protein GpartN1_g7468.t1 [Galdieria partita]
MDRKFVKINFAQGSLEVVKDRDDNLCCMKTKSLLELVRYGLFSSGFWTMEESLLFYFELVSGILTSDVLFIFYNENAQRLFSILLQLLEREKGTLICITDRLEKQQFIITTILKTLCEEYKQQFSELSSVSESGGDRLLLTDLYQINSKCRQMSLLKQTLESFLSTIQQCVFTNQVLSKEGEGFLGTLPSLVTIDITSIVVDTIDTLERVEQSLMELEKKSQKYSEGVKQEYLSFLAPFVFQRFLVCLFTWNALLIECFHSNFFKVETIRGFVTLTMGAPFVALIATLSFAYYCRRKHLCLFAKDDIGLSND